MAFQVINIGTSPDDDSGDPIRTAFNKTNANFLEAALDVEVHYFVNAKEHGAVGDGVTDDRAAIQAAIDAADAAGGGLVLLPRGTYNITTTPGLDLKAGVVLWGEGPDATHIRQGWWGGTLITATGTEGAELTTLTANAAPGDTTLTLANTAGIAADDHLLLGADRAFANSTDTESGNNLKYVGEIVRVASVDSGTAVTLYGMVRDDYGTANAAGVQLITFIRGCGVRNLRIFNPEPNQHTGGGLGLRQTQDFIVDNVVFEALDSAGINLVNAVDGTVSNCGFRDLTDNSALARFGYGINIQRATQNVGIANCYFRRGRHGISTGAVAGIRGVPRSIVISNCVAELANAASFDTHLQGEDLTFVGCKAMNGEHAGFYVRAHNVKLISCSTEWCPFGALVDTLAEGTEIIGCSFKKIISLGITNDGQGITLQAPKRITILGTSVADCTGSCVRISDDATDVLIANCSLQNPGIEGTAGPVINAVDGTRLRIVNNVLGDWPNAINQPFDTGDATYGVDLGTSVLTSQVYGNRGVGLSQAVARDQAGTNRLRANYHIDANNVLLLDGDGTSTAPALSFEGDPDTGLYRSGTGEMSVAIDGTQRVKFVGDNMAIAGDIFNLGSFNNARLQLDTGGATIDRNITGAGHALRVNQIHASSTGAILEMQAAGTTASEFPRDGGLRMVERADPSAPAANSGIIYMRDNGSGKTQFVALFPSGVVQVIATEP